ncbi:MAG: helix-turn-helix domain-containing protein [Holosporales bacterium]|jgi:transcriptional regulator with XRE-family HTH domain|nr:helix-turn-helix domain-containing protein [Holosporales bacterium]
MNINVHIGKKLRERRKKAGFTLEHVSAALQVTYQQIQKYESGKNKIPIDKLYDCACLFQVPVQYFFEEIPLSQSSLEIVEDKFVLQKHERNHLNLLLAESDPMDEFLIRKSFGELDNEIKIFCVHNNVQIINFLKYSNPVFPKPDLIFMDLNISKKNEHAIIIEIKRDKMLQDIPIIILANNICKDDLVKVYKNGAASFICKSISHDKMKKDLHVCIQYWGHVVVLPNIVLKKVDSFIKKDIV